MTSLTKITLFSILVLSVNFTLSGCSFARFTSEIWFPEKVTWHNTVMEADSATYAIFKDSTTVNVKQTEVDSNSKIWFAMDTMLTFRNGGDFQIDEYIIQYSPIDSSLSYWRKFDLIGHNFGTWSGLGKKVTLKYRRFYSTGIHGPVKEMPGTKMRQEAVFVRDKRIVTKVIYNGRTFIPFKQFQENTQRGQKEFKK